MQRFFFFSKIAQNLIKNKSQLQINESNEEVPVLAITHWTEELFSFSLRRPKSFRFSAGEFVMLGLTTEDGQQILRAYS